jgi:hypothetical protein
MAGNISADGEFLPDVDAIFAPKICSLVGW